MYTTCTQVGMCIQSYTICRRQRTTGFNIGSNMNHVLYCYHWMRFKQKTNVGRHGAMVSESGSWSVRRQFEPRLRFPLKSLFRCMHDFFGYMCSRFWMTCFTDKCYAENLTYIKPTQQTMSNIRLAIFLEWQVHVNH